MKACPDCVGFLHEHFVENSTCYCCNICEGLWFNKMELSKLLIKDQFLFNKTSLNDIFYNKTEKKLKKTMLSIKKQCPFCTEKPLLVMNKKKKHFFCPSCKEIWLKKGSIQKLRRTFFKNFSFGILVFILLAMIFIIIMMGITSSPQETSDQANVQKKKQVQALFKNSSPLMLAPLKVIIPSQNSLLDQKKEDT